MYILTKVYKQNVFATKSKKEREAYKVSVVHVTAGDTKTLQEGGKVTAGAKTMDSEEERRQWLELSPGGSG